MIEIKNLRKEDRGEWTRLVADFLWGGVETTCVEQTIWFAVKKEHAHMLTTEVYDAFVLVPLYLAMYYKTDLKIHGKISKKLYKNIQWYIQKILCDFSDDLSPVNLSVDGFGTVDAVPSLIGTGISCGVDSLSTIYNHYVKENDPEYKINALFIFNCGTHGDYENHATKNLYQSRYERNKKAADELGLPIYQVDSNLHAFTHLIGEQKVGYFAIYSCTLCLEHVICRYYASSTYSYQDIKVFNKQAHNFDMAEFCESYMIPLVRTETFELISDGCQYQRSEKTRNIADWEIAQKHLNVCVNSKHGENCSMCSKCMRTLIPLEAMGKLDEFSKIFDLKVYRDHALKNKCNIVADFGKEGYATDNVDFARKMGLHLPSRLVAGFVMLPSKGSMMMKRVIPAGWKNKLKRILKR